MHLPSYVGMTQHLALTWHRTEHIRTDWTDRMLWWCIVIDRSSWRDSDYFKWSLFRELWSFHFVNSESYCLLLFITVWHFYELKKQRTNLIIIVCKVGVNRLRVRTWPYLSFSSWAWNLVYGFCAMTFSCSKTFGANFLIFIHVLDNGICGIWLLGIWYY